MKNEELYCDVCRRPKTEFSHFAVRSAEGIPVSLHYCEECTKRGFVSQMELLWFLANHPDAFSTNDQLWRNKIVNNIRTFFNYPTKLLDMLPEEQD